MTFHSQIRGEFIQRYSEREAMHWEASSRMVDGRNEEHRALNIEFGYAELDGAFGIGCKSHIDQEYKHLYDEIENRFRIPYDNQLPAFHRWALENGMTIYECLLMDNIGGNDLKALAELCATQEDWQLHPIKKKSSLLVTGWKGEHTVGEIQQRVKIESSQFNYAATRCRKLMGLKPWDLSAQKAILDYGKEWKSSLQTAFDSLTAV